jgi:fructose-1,6-bisphosphatase/inositol monophosphatase family enzyme
VLLENAAKEAVLAGAMAAMGFYHGPLTAVEPATPDRKNPSTLADLESTLMILRSIHARLDPLARSIGCNISYFGEEITPDYWIALEAQLNSEILACVDPPETFFQHNDNTLRVIIDGIDGTGSFMRGLPLFCTAAAILVDHQVRVSAIYDPIHHVVYSGVLAGPVADPEASATAVAWHVSSGNRMEFSTSSQRTHPRTNSHELAHEAVGVHFTRTKKEKLHDFVGCETWLDKSMMERLAEASGAVYALNSGILAMTEVARGVLGGFVNIITNPWDVAAGEVLVRACGGVVTDFAGLPIDYCVKRDISVVAARKALHEQILNALDSRTVKR